MNLNHKKLIIILYIHKYVKKNYYYYLSQYKNIYIFQIYLMSKFMSGFLTKSNYWEANILDKSADYNILLFTF